MRAACGEFSQGSGRVEPLRSPFVCGCGAGGADRRLRPGAARSLAWWEPLEARAPAGELVAEQGSPGAGGLIRVPPGSRLNSPPPFFFCLRGARPRLGESLDSAAAGRRVGRGPERPEAPQEGCCECAVRGRGDTKDRGGGRRGRRAIVSRFRGAQLLAHRPASPSLDLHPRLRRRELGRGSPPRGRAGLIV